MINIDAHKLVGCITMFVWIGVWSIAGDGIGEEFSKDSDLVKYLGRWAGLLGGIGSWYLVARFLFKKDSPQDNWREIEDEWSEIDE